MISGVDHKLGHQKIKVEKVSPSERSVILVRISSSSTLSQTKQSKFLVTYALTATSVADKSALIFSAPSPINTTAFELVTPS